MVEGNPVLRELGTTLHGAISSANVSVGTTAAALQVGSKPQLGRKLLMIHNRTGGSLYIGGSDVTTSNGVELSSGTIREFSLGRGVLYGIRSSGSGDVRVIEFS